MSTSGYLLFISKPTGYELRERQGDLPGVGQEIGVPPRPSTRVFSSITRPPIVCVTAATT